MFVPSIFVSASLCLCGEKSVGDLRFLGLFQVDDAVADGADGGLGAVLHT